MTDVDSLSQEDRLVLHCIQQGHDNTRAIRRNTDLTRRQVEYRLDEKLPKRGLIEKYQPDGYMEEVIDGQKRVFRAPKHARLSEKGEQVVAAIDTPEPEPNEPATGEIAGRIQELEARVDELERNLKQLRRHIASQ